MPYLTETKLSGYIQTIDKLEEYAKKQTDTIARLTAFNESMQTDADRASLRIIAKDMQIAELTRMLFTLGKQDGQVIRELTEENRGLRQMLHMEPK